MSVPFEKAPMCDVTGLPLPIFHKEPPSNGAPFSIRNKKNLHHSFHPEKSPLLNTVGGLAVRASRVQLVDFNLHTNYHRLFGGSVMPEIEDEDFEIAVMCAAGVVPRRAVDVRKPWSYREVSLGDYHHSFLARSKIIRVEDPKPLAKFFAEYAAKQGIKDLIDNRVIDEFLDKDTTYEVKRQHAGFMLATALDLSLEGLNQTYKEYKKEGYLHSGAENLRMVTKRLVHCHSLMHFSQNVEQQFAPA